MRLEHYPSEKLIKEIIKIVGKHLDISKYKVFLFGSRVTDKGDERSDIDIGIEGPEPVLPKTMLEIEEEIEKLPVLYKIEIVDFQRVPLKFREVARKNIEFLTP